jgi:hypothetical protein
MLRARISELESIAKRKAIFSGLSNTCSTVPPKKNPRYQKNLVVIYCCSKCGFLILLLFHSFRLNITKLFFVFLLKLKKLSFQL